MEPTQDDIAAVAATLSQPAQQPAPAPQPAPAAPAQPAEQPAAAPAPAAEPTDPFAMFAQPTEPAATPQPAQPTEPIQQPTATPTEPAAQPPAQAPAQQPAQDYQTYDEYMTSILAGIPETPAAQPDPSQVDPNDPNAIKGFFDDLMGAAEKRFEANYARKQAVQSAEKKAWDDAFEKYGSLRTNKDLRDMVHSIRMANFQKGIAMTPTQAAQKLVDALKAQYNQGINDNQVVTTIESVQPQGGGSGAPVSTTLDTQNTLQAIQTGGEAALANFLDQEVKAGRL